MDKMLQRSFNAVFRKKTEDAEDRTVTFVASTGTRDSAHTVLNQDGWDLSRFNANPVIGYNHEIYGAWDTKDIDFVIGKGRAYVEDGKLMVDITFEPREINELAEKVYQKVLFGSINAVSVGFMPVGRGAWGKGDEGPGEENETYYYAGQELLEISVVNVPSNPEAVKRGRDAIGEELEALRAEAAAPEAPSEEEERSREAEMLGDRKALTLAEVSLLL